MNFPQFSILFIMSSIFKSSFGCQLVCLMIS